MTYSGEWYIGTILKETEDAPCAARAKSTDGV